MDLSLVSAVVAAVAGAVVGVLLPKLLDRARLPSWTSRWIKELRADGWYARVEALKQLSHTDCRGAVPGVARLLDRERDWQVAVQAAETLSAIGDSRAVPSLRRALLHPHQYARRAAALSLGTFARSDGVVQDLVVLLERDHSTDARHGAAVALGRLGASGAERALRGLVSSSEQTSDGESLAAAATDALAGM